MGLPSLVRLAMEPVYLGTGGSSWQGSLGPETPEGSVGLKGASGKGWGCCEGEEAMGGDGELADSKPQRGEGGGESEGWPHRQGLLSGQECKAGPHGRSVCAEDAGVQSCAWEGPGGHRAAKSAESHEQPAPKFQGRRARAWERWRPVSSALR